MPSPFQRGLREFGLVIARLIPVLVVIVPATRVLLGRPVLDALLFAVALAVGLTPELLPMITTVTLSRGAMRIASRKVIVKRHVECLDRGRVANPQRFVCRAELLRNRYRESAADSDLRVEFGVNDEGVGLILNLVDLLYTIRRTLMELRHAVRATSEQG